MLRIENWTSGHAQAQHCWANLVKQLQHHATSTDFALKNLTIFKFEPTTSNMKVKNDHCSEFSNLSNWKEEAWENQGFNGIWTRDLCEYQCDALPTELWSKVNLLSSYVLEEWNGVKYIWNNSYVNCGDRWKGRMIKAKKKPEKIWASTGFEPWVHR